MEKHLPKKKAKEVLQRLLSVLDCSSVELSVLFTGDNEIQELNSHFRQKDKPTDVLSFPLASVGKGIPIRALGDIVISCDTAFKQARKYGVCERDELLRLLIHGLLHLLGYDHEGVSSREAQKMRRLEQTLYKQIRVEMFSASRK